MHTSTENPSRALILSGNGRYADPWHPFGATSACLAALLRDAGWSVEVREDVDAALGGLDSVDLLVVNTGDPARNNDGVTDVADPAAIAVATASLDAALERGIGVVAIHTAVSSLRDYPRWVEVVGGEWRPGTSWHPPIAQSEVEIVDPGHPITDGVTGISLYDEMYTDLVRADDVHVLAAHTLEGVVHPVVWTREDAARAVVCALGHEARAYESPELRGMLQRAAEWAVRRR
ncbi:ThuA domain-containing protein [Microbacterium sp. C7(2022)]|uniref:ThuA domain-containing protein n=1 Tax=Microbacterium sp. C7(2022) TaxID=2992759 RepID=UPI00237A72DC|nr:ThuA domain-containing protein [Microbacterium sp. C7(2022)]MDE0546631.1 ThuA domain-containing protein [Microbacterium sp. C7(2022)]